MPTNTLQDKVILISQKGDTVDCSNCASFQFSIPSTRSLPIHCASEFRTHSTPAYTNYSWLFEKTGAAQTLHTVGSLHHLVAGDLEHLHDRFPDDGLIFDDYDAHDILSGESIAEGDRQGA